MFAEAVLDGDNEDDAEGANGAAAASAGDEDGERWDNALMLKF